MITISIKKNNPLVLYFSQENYPVGKIGTNHSIWFDKEITKIQHYILIRFGPRMRFDQITMVTDYCKLVTNAVEMLEKLQRNK